ncbi:MAG: MFS transporter [Chloroflexi bacterium]|nr:MFS transporter [Chloroflexota bacterium]
MQRTGPTPISRAPLADRLPFFYGWLILGMGCLATSIAYGIRGSFSVFYVAILQDFGWSRAETALIFSTGVAVYGFTAPISGALIDRFGPRKVMPVGCMLIAIGTAASSQANSIWQFCLFFALLSMGACLTAFVPYSTVVSRWFVRRRAFAFSILNAGSNTSFSFPLMSELLIASGGWRLAYLWLAGLVAIVLLPLETLFARRHPADVGQHPDGVPPDPRPIASRVVPALSGVVDRQWAATDWTLGRALRTYRFWAVCIANLTLWGLGQNLLVAHQVAFAVDIGFSATLAATVALVYGLSSSIGAAGGYISDRIGREWTFTIGCSMAIVGVAILIAARYVPSVWILYAYAVIMGTGFGLAGPALTSSLADLFAGPNYGAITGGMVMGFGVGGAVGPWLGGLIYDRTGQYVPAFIFVMAVIGVAVVSLWIAGPRQVRRPAR